MMLALCQAVPLRAQNATIVSAVLAKNYVNGEASGVTTVFKPGNRKIHCVLRLSRPTKTTTLRFVWIATDVGKAAPPNTKIIKVTLPAKLIDRAIGQPENIASIFTATANWRA